MPFFARHTKIDQRMVYILDPAPFISLSITHLCHNNYLKKKKEKKESVGITIQTCTLM